MSELPKITVAVVEPQHLNRDALCALLERNDEIEVIGAVADADHLMALVATRHPDVVILSMDSSSARGIALLDTLPRLADDTRALVITGVVDADLHARAIELGAAGIVLTTHSAHLLIKAVQKIHAGELWLDRAQMANVVSRLTRRQIARDPESMKRERLTARERQIVALGPKG